MSRSFSHFLIGLFVFIGIELYVLLVYFGDYSISVASFEIIFSHSEGYLFIVCIVSFAVQKLLSLIRPHVFIFVFISIRKWVKEDHAAVYVKECSAYVFL